MVHEDCESQVSAQTINSYELSFLVRRSETFYQKETGRQGYAYCDDGGDWACWIHLVRILYGRRIMSQLSWGGAVEDPVAYSRLKWSFDARCLVQGQVMSLFVLFVALRRAAEMECERYYGKPGFWQCES